MAEEKRWRVEGKRGVGRGGGVGGGRQEGRTRMAPHPSSLPSFPFLPFIFSIIIIFVFAVPLTSATFDFVVRPEFGERQGDLNVTTFAGQTAHLPCSVKHLAGKRVSWIRGRDLQVLSTGRITFSTDVRISVLPGVNMYKSRTARSVAEGKEEEREEVWRKKQEKKQEKEKVWRKQLQNEEGKVWKKKQEYKEEGDEVWRKKQEQMQELRMMDKERAARIEMVVLHSSSSSPSSSSSSSSTVIPPHTTPPVPHPPRYTPPHHTAHHHHHYLNHTHHTKSHTTTHHHHQYHHQSSQRRKRRVDWPAYFYYPQHHHQHHHYHEEDTISGLGGSPAWFHRELARFNFEAGAGGPGRDRGRSYTSDAQNSIAIYPQGPLSQNSQGKGNVPGPNYIEGVWEPEDYTLQIKYTKLEDAGTYICQINTEPRITQAVRLSVVNMRAEIVGSQELYVKAGTPVTLACKVNHGTLMPGFILWYKGDRLVEYDTSGGRISVTTEPTGVSHLLLRHATPGDSANYTCSPSAGAPASLTLNVIVDERQAAMQQGNAAPPPLSPHHYLLPPTLALMWGSSGRVWEGLGGVLGVLLMVGEGLCRPHFSHLLPLLSIFFVALDHEGAEAVKGESGGVKETAPQEDQHDPEGPGTTTEGTSNG